MVVFNIEHNIPTHNLWMYYNDFSISFKISCIELLIFFYFKLHENSIYLPIRKVVNLERFTGVEIVTM